MTSKTERNRVDLGGYTYSRKKTQEETEQEARSKEIERLVAEQQALKTQAYIKRLSKQNEEAKAKLEQPAQTESETVQLTSKHEVMYANKWLFEKVFSEGRNQKELVDEWLEIRKSKDFKEPPDNPLASMNTAINEERKRRRQL